MRDPETWDRLYASALNLSHQNQFKRLNQQWLRHAPYSHCSPEGLLKIAQIIEKLYVAIAQLEKDAPRYAIYKKEKLALDLYRKHLQNYKTLLKAQQDYIAEALGAHIIEALKTRDLNAHELLSGLYRELNKEIKGFTPLNSTLPLARAYHYCIKRGNPSLSQSLEKVMHLGQHNLLTVLRQKKELLLVPQSLVKFVPEKPALFTRLSKGHQLRYEFFKNKQDLLFKLASLQMPFDGDPSWELDDVRWQTLEQLSNQVEEALQQAKQIPVMWFNKESIQFVKGWTTLLERQKKEITIQKMGYLSELADTPQPLHWASAYSNQSKALNSVLQKMEETASSFNADEYASWEKLKHQLEIRKLPSNAICLLNDALSKIRYGDTLSPKSLTKLSVELQCMADHHKDTFKTYHSAYSDQLLSSLRQQLSELEWAINNQSDLPDAHVICQTLDLICLIDNAAETNSDLSDCYQTLYSIFTHFKAMSKELTPEAIQSHKISKLNDLLSDLAYFHEEWSELEMLFDDAQTYQKDILENRTPMTFEEVEEIGEQITRRVKEADQQHNDFMAKATQTLLEIQKRREAREQHGFLTSVKSNNCVNNIDSDTYASKMTNN